MDEDLKPRYSTKRLRQEIERARNNDAQTIAALEAQLAKASRERDYWQSQHDERTRQLGLYALEATPPAPKVTEAMVEAALKAFHSVGRYASEKARMEAALTAAQESGQ